MFEREEIDFLNAAKTGDIEKIKDILNSSEYINITNINDIRERNNKNNALILASYYNHVDVVKFLLDYGVYINAVNANYCTSLFAAS